MRITCTAAPLHARYAAPRVLSIVCGTAKKHHLPKCPGARESSASKASQRDDCGSLLAECSGGPWGRVCGPCLPTGPGRHQRQSISKPSPFTCSHCTTVNTPACFLCCGFLSTILVVARLGSGCERRGLGTPPCIEDGITGRAGRRLALHSPGGGGRLHLGRPILRRTSRAKRF